MATSYTLIAKDLPKDLAGGLEAFRRHALFLESTEETSTSLMVTASHWEPLRVVAEFVPADQRGFKFGLANPNYTYSELQALEPGATGGTVKHLSYHGYGGNGFPLGKLDALTKALGKLSPGASRRTSVHISIRDARWCGSTTGSKGSVSMSDSKGLGRKIRFHLASVVSFPTSVGKKAEKADIGAIREATGIDFSSAKTRKYIESKPVRTPDLASACLAFDHAVSVVAEDLRLRGFEWRTLKGSHPDGNGLILRMEAMRGPKPEPFRYETVLRAFMKASFPFLKKQASFPYDGHLFAEKLSEKWSFGISFDTSPGIRIGKIFKVRCALFSDGNSTLRFMRTAPLLLCGGGDYFPHSDTCPEFVYGTLEEYEEILAGLRPFILDFIERFRAVFASIFVPALEDLSSAMPVSGALTCREALERAKLLLDAQGRGPMPLKFCRMDGVVGIGLHYRNDPTAQAPADGRLNANFKWSFVFGTPEGDDVAVYVPYAGSIRAALRPRNKRVVHVGRIEEYIPEGSPWWDSDAVAPLFFRAFETIKERYPNFAGLVAPFSLRVFRGRVLWVGKFEMASTGESKAWVLVTHAVDAEEGTVFSTHFDERFQDRPLSHSEFTEGGPKIEG
jgi:hypothetical protein